MKMRKGTKETKPKVVSLFDGDAEMRATARLAAANINATADELEEDDCWEDLDLQIGKACRTWLFACLDRIRAFEETEASIPRRQK